MQLHISMCQCCFEKELYIQKCFKETSKYIFQIHTSQKCLKETLFRMLCRKR